MHVHAGEVRLAGDTAAEPDVTITGGIADFMQMARSQRDGTPHAAGQVDIQGDLASAQQVQALLADTTIDFEAMLAVVTGDVAARQVGRGLRAGLGWYQNAQRVIEQDVGEYLRYEARMLPDHDTIEAFVRERTALGEDVDRLAARIERLKRRRSP